MNEFLHYLALYQVQLLDTTLGFIINHLNVLVVDTQIYDYLITANYKL